nr:Tn501 repressor [Shigella flexneri 5a str. M90T]
MVQTCACPFELKLDSVTLLPYSCTESSDMENNLENLTIGVFAKAAGVNVETIRFYQRKGLLLEPDKPYGSIRRYGEADVTRVRFVKSAQRLGFSLDEIAELLRLEDGTHCEEASSLAEHKLKDVREKMADLARMEAVLSELVCACHARRGNVSCPLIASLQGGASLAGSAMP